jgi:membrane protein required for colicin V production
MNTFDAVVYICLVVAVVMGFRSGLLRSLATIFGYITAMPAAIAVSPYLVRFLNSQSIQSPALNWLAIFAVFLVIGMALSALLRIAVSELVGSDISIADRAAGATLGAVRVVLLAVLMVLIFDRIIPANTQPSFLVGSRLRPTLSVAGQWGLTSLPPGVPAYIDRLKQQHGI